MAFIESHQELRDHPKTKKAARLLDISVPQFLGHLHLLWWWAYDYADDGDLSGYENAEIADAAMWGGDPGLFVESLGNCGKPGSPGYIEINQQDGAITVHLHDWDEYAGKIIRKRKADADRKRNARLGLSAGTNQPVRRTSDGHPPDGAGTVPYHTIPNLNMCDDADEDYPYSQLDEIFDEFWTVFPTRNGTKRGPKEDVKTRFAKIPAKEWPIVARAAKNYADFCREAVQFPVDPLRFLSSRDYPSGLWREYREPVKVSKNGKHPEPLDISHTEMPQAGYSWDKNADGSWKKQARDPATGLFPYGLDDYQAVLERDAQEKEKFLARLRGVA